MSDELPEFQQHAKDLYKSVKDSELHWPLVMKGRDEPPEWMGVLFGQVAIVTLGEDVEFFRVSVDLLPGSEEWNASLVGITSQRVLTAQFSEASVAAGESIALEVRRLADVSKVTVHSYENVLVRRPLASAFPASVQLHFADGFEVAIRIERSFEADEPQGLLDTLLGALS